MAFGKARSQQKPPSCQPSTMPLLPVTILFLILTCVIPVVTKSMRSLQDIPSSCETLPSSIHIIKEEYDDKGKLVRTCEGDVAVSKCEGTCSSQMQPSVTTSSGFIKECRCCRETNLRERQVELRRCYDLDGRTISAEQGQMLVKLKEPDDCKCFKCGD